MMLYFVTMFKRNLLLNFYSENLIYEYTIKIFDIN